MYVKLVLSCETEANKNTNVALFCLSSVLSFQNQLADKLFTPYTIVLCMYVQSILKTTQSKLQASGVARSFFT